MEATVLDVPPQVAPKLTPPPAPVQVREDLICQIAAEAKARLRYSGWRQGGIGNATEGYCLLGAIIQVERTSDHDKLVMQHTQVLIERIARKIGWSGYDGVHHQDLARRAIALWNDRSGNTKENVLHLLDEMTDCRT